MIRPSPRRSTASAGMSGSAIGCLCPHRPDVAAALGTDPGIPPLAMAIGQLDGRQYDRWRPARLESTRSNAAPGHPRRPPPCRSWSARSAPTRESNGTLLSTPLTFVAWRPTWRPRPAPPRAIATSALANIERPVAGAMASTSGAPMRNSWPSRTAEHGVAQVPRKPALGLLHLVRQQPGRLRSADPRSSTTLGVVVAI